MAESMTKHEVIQFSYPLDLASNWYGYGYGIDALTQVRKCTSQYAWMMLSHSIVAPQNPWDVNNRQSLM